MATGTREDVVDLLLKQHDEIRSLLDTVERSSGERRKQKFDELRRLLAVLGPGEDRSGARRKRYVVRTPKGHYFVPAQDVECAVADGNYVALHAGGRVHLVRETMTSFEAGMDPAEFVHIHRSIVVRIDAIARVEPTGSGEYRVVLKSGARFESSRAYGDRVRALLR